MVRPGRNRTKILSDEELVFEGALKRRANIRAVIGLGLIVIAGILLFYAFVPLIAKSTMPLLWVEYANQHGWTKEMQQIGLRLLANGRIEVIPSWVSYGSLAGVAILGWLGIQLIRCRWEAKALGDSVSLGYWLNFYWFKKPVDQISVDFKKVRK